MDDEHETSEHTTAPTIYDTDQHIPRHSDWIPRPSAAGAAMKGVTYETHLEKTLKTMHRTQDNSDVLGIADDDPTYKEAMQAHDASEWDASYDDEIKSMKQHKVWTLLPCTDVPKGCWILGSRTVFLQKHNEKNEVTRHKTRIVAKGFSQIEGIDYTNTFALVTRLESVWTVLSIAASLDWEIYQFDVKTAFLHGDLTEDIYMEQPEGRKE